jgi:hypothetical protein
VVAASSKYRMLEETNPHRQVIEVRKHDNVIGFGKFRNTALCETDVNARMRILQKPQIVPGASVSAQEARRREGVGPYLSCRLNRSRRAPDGYRSFDERAQHPDRDRRAAPSLKLHAGCAASAR